MREGGCKPSRSRARHSGGLDEAARDATPLGRWNDVRAQLSARLPGRFLSLPDDISPYRDALCRAYEIGFLSVLEDNEREGLGGRADDWAVCRAPSVRPNHVRAGEALVKLPTTHHQDARAIQQIAFPVGKEAPDRRNGSASGTAVEGEDVVSAYVTLVETLGARL